MTAISAVSAGSVDVSVVIPMFNGEEIIARSLDALISELQSSRLSHEIIVVDDASSDGSVRLVRDRYPQVQLMVNPRNSGFAFTCNRGMRRSRGGLVLLLNTDAVVGPGSVKTVWEFMSKRPDVGGAACRVLADGGVLEKSCREFPSLSRLMTGRALRMMQRWFPAYAAERSVD